MRAEVVIVGAGPAGSVAALNLAPVRDVIVLDAAPTDVPRVGHALVSAAGRLLADMGLLDGLLRQGHAAWHGNLADWGHGGALELDFLRGPGGPGWHLDRACFDGWLRACARARGARMVAPARLSAIEAAGTGWTVRASSGAGQVEIRADLIVDASGRASAVARRLGCRRIIGDRLACGWVQRRAANPSTGAGIARIHAEAGGWWYLAPAPGSTRILAFHTDPDLPQARDAANPSRLLARALGVPGLGPLLAGLELASAGPSGYAAAGSGRLAAFCGPGWLAAGDAAISVDPLSSQGLMNALFTGLAVAEAADRHLGGDATALGGYSEALTRVWNAYVRQLRAAYRDERRWPDAPFWHRRRNADEVSGAGPSRAARRTPFPASSPGPPSEAG